MVPEDQTSGSTFSKAKLGVRSIYLRTNDAVRTGAYTPRPEKAVASTSEAHRPSWLRLVMPFLTVLAVFYVLSLVVVYAVTLEPRTTFSFDNPSRPPLLGCVLSPNQSIFSVER